jgi:hypothetical protein
MSYLDYFKVMLKLDRTRFDLAAFLNFFLISSFEFRVVFQSRKITFTRCIF